MKTILFLTLVSFLAFAEPTLAADLREERLVLEPLRSKASVVIDTTQLSARALTDKLRGLFGTDNAFTLALFSFGFKHGAPAQREPVGAHGHFQRHRGDCRRTLWRHAVFCRREPDTAQRVCRARECEQQRASLVSRPSTGGSSVH